LRTKEDQTARYVAALRNPDIQILGHPRAFFCVSDFDSNLKRARTLAAQLAEEPRLNPNTRALEFSLRDPDGYYVTVSAFNPA
jgi:hypothetical protein